MTRNSEKCKKRKEMEIDIKKRQREDENQIGERLFKDTRGSTWREAPKLYRLREGLP